MTISFSKIENSFNEIKIALALIHPERVPVHVGLLLYDFFLEATLKGPIIREREVFFKWASSNTEGVCLVELVEQSKQNMGIENLKSFFINNALINECSTCIDPVVRIIGFLTNRDLKAIGTIFDLIPYLETNRLINNFYWIGKFPKESLSIAPYNREFVLSSLNSSLHA